MRLPIWRLIKHRRTATPGNHPQHPALPATSAREPVLSPVATLGITFRQTARPATRTQTLLAGATARTATTPSLPMRPERNAIKPRAHVMSPAATPVITFRQTAKHATQTRTLHAAATAQTATIRSRPMRLSQM